MTMTRWVSDVRGILSSTCDAATNKMPFSFHFTKVTRHAGVFQETSTT